MGANEQVLESRIKHLELRICSDKKSFLNHRHKKPSRSVTGFLIRKILKKKFQNLIAGG